MPTKIPATNGDPYHIRTLNGRKQLVSVRRGKHSLIFSPADFYAVTNAVTDIFEQDTNRDPAD